MPSDNCSSQSSTLVATFSTASMANFSLSRSSNCDTENAPQDFAYDSTESTLESEPIRGHFFALTSGKAAGLSQDYIVLSFIKSRLPGDQKPLWTAVI